MVTSHSRRSSQSPAPGVRTNCKHKYESQFKKNKNQKIIYQIKSKSKCLVYFVTTHIRCIGR